MKYQDGDRLINFTYQTSVISDRPYIWFEIHLPAGNSVDYIRYVNLDQTINWLEPRVRDEFSLSDQAKSFVERTIKLLVFS